MPLPWKKAKGKSFSQLLTNHLVPPKHGASLVVETGFPTSLADLFVKNRNRFNNNNNYNSDNNNNNRNDISINKRKKKKKKNETGQLDPVPEPFDSPNPEPVLNSLPLTPPQLLSIPQISRDIVVDDWINLYEAVDRDNKTNIKVVKGKDVFVAVLKMFFVVILALGANKFAVGIALSAFLLFFMEYLGKCLEGSRLFQLLKRRNKAPIEETKFDNSCNLNSSKDSLGLEIQILQPSSSSGSSIREIPNDKYEFIVQSGKEKWAMEEREEEEVIGQKKQEVCMYQSELLLCDGNTGKDSRRRSTLRSKIKKFASKLNSSKRKQKKKKAKESKFDAFGYENAQATNWHNIEREFDDFSSFSSPSTGEDSDHDDQIHAQDSISPENSSNNGIVEGERGRERNSPSGGHLPILVIVLAGLVGSRVLAVVYTLSWFFLLKTKLGTRLRYITSGYQ